MSEQERQMQLGLTDGIRDGWAVGTSSLADIVYDRTHGPTEMLHVFVYIAIWGKFFELTGREPTSGRELSGAMKMPNKTLARYRIRFESAFPELENPRPLWEAFASDVEADDPPELVAFKLGQATT